MYNYPMIGSLKWRFAFFVLAAFIIVSLYGAASSIGMQKNAQGKMTGCMFTGTAICTMTPFEHLAEWQSMFSATAPQSVNTLALLLLVAVTFA